VVLSTLKPSEDGVGVVLRLQNPTDRVLQADVRLAPQIARAIGEAESVALDESPDRSWEGGEPFVIDADGVGRLKITLPPHALRSLLLRPHR
jgi:hypothetical protein